MIIGITGKKRSGKDTISDFLVEKYYFVKYGFADPIKDIARIIFGFTENQLFEKEKDIVDENWGFKPRDFFQKFGTDYGQFIFPKHFPEIFKDKDERSLWIMVFKRWYLNKLKENPYLKVVISDVRFNHEFECIKDLGGYVIKVKRDNTIKDNHISENELDNLEFDHKLSNNGTKEELFKKIINIIN